MHMAIRVEAESSAKSKIVPVVRRANESGKLMGQADNPRETLAAPHRQPWPQWRGFSDPKGSGFLDGLTLGHVPGNKGGAAYVNRLPPR